MSWNLISTFFEGKIRIFVTLSCSGLWRSLLDNTRRLRPRRVRLRRGSLWCGVLLHGYTITLRWCCGESLLRCSGVPMLRRCSGEPLLGRCSAGKPLLRRCSVEPLLRRCSGEPLLRRRSGKPLLRCSGIPLLRYSSIPLLGLCPITLLGRGC